MNDENDESRRMVEQCYRAQKTLVNPIIDWKDEDVWEFIKQENINYCGLYDCGNKRLGCLGCPMARSARFKEFEKYPKYYNLYLRTFEKMIDKRNELNKPTTWKSGEEVMYDWLHEKTRPINGQVPMDYIND